MKTDGPQLRYSVIIPVYNVEKYLDKCFSTVLPQLDSRTEVICVDDGSTDRSGDICDAYAEKCKLVTVYHKENGGVASARNSGLEKAHGEYILWVDPDDYVSGEWFSTIDEQIEKYAPDCLLFDTYEVKKDKVSERHCFVEETMTKDAYIFELSSEKRIPSYLCTKVIKRKLFSRAKFDANLAVFEDYQILTDLAPTFSMIRYIPKCLYYYLRRQDSLMNDISIERQEQAIAVSEKRYRTFKEKGFRVSPAGWWMQMVGYCFMYDGVQKECRADYQKYKRYLKSHAVSILCCRDLRLRFKLKMLVAVLCSATFCYKLRDYVRRRRFSK